MPALPLGAGESNRTVGRLPRLRCRNMVMERDPTNSVDGIAWLQRPGLVELATIGAGPINGIWQQDGTFNGDTLIVSGSLLIRRNAGGVQTEIGSLGTGRVQVAASATRAIIVSEGTAYRTDGTTRVPVNMPDGVQVGSVAYLDGYFFLSVLNSQRVYFIEPGDDDPDGLAFFEAERAPDPLVTLGVLGDELWLIGGETEEVWAPSGDPDAPMQRQNARAYQNGCLNRDTLVDVDGTLAWVSAESEVILSKGAPQAVSTPSVTEHLRNSDPTSMRAWRYALDGHLIYVLTTNTITLAYDLSTQIWAVFASEAAETWRAHLGTGLLAGSADSGDIWRLDPTRSDDGGAAMVRELSGGVEVIGVPQRCNSVAARVAVGWTASTETAPVLELCWSDDEGATYSAWRQVSLGGMGAHRTPVVWRKLGMMRRPGRIFRFRMTSDAIFRLSHVTYNEAWG